MLRMQFMSLLAATLLAGGCASVTPVAVESQPVPPPSERPAVASALVFTPRPALYGPAVDLSRDGRERAAYVGYELGTITSVYVRQDDDVRNFGRGDDNSFFRRRAISTRISTQTR